MNGGMRSQRRGDLFCGPDREPDAWIEVSTETMALLRQIASMLNCTVNAALDEAVREFALNA